MLPPCIAMHPTTPSTLRLPSTMRLVTLPCTSSTVTFTLTKPRLHRRPHCKLPSSSTTHDHHRAKPCLQTALPQQQQTQTSMSSSSSNFRLVYHVKTAPSTTMRHHDSRHGETSTLLHLQRTSHTFKSLHLLSTPHTFEPTPLALFNSQSTLKPS